jgi:hypothetical protein
MATAGLFLTVTLIASGALLLWAHSFIGNEVHTQLAAQQIFFPAANSKAVAAPEFAAMRQYGGQQLTTGAQAEVYADHFIASHLKAAGGGKTYAQLSAEAIAQPKNTALEAQVATAFKGETLRGLLLNAYAFGTMGMIAGIAAIAAFIAAAGQRPAARPERNLDHPGSERVVVTALARGCHHGPFGVMIAPAACTG